MGLSKPYALPFASHLHPLSETFLPSLQSLDIQYTVGVATNVPTTFYSDGEPDVFGFIDMANTLLAQDEVPLVLSTSYGFNENVFMFDQDIAK